MPHQAVYFATRNAVYTCNVDNALDVQWYFNGTMQHFNNTYNSDFGVGVMKIYNISIKFNSTSIECEGVYSNNGVARSVAGFIFVQGMYLRQACEKQHFSLCVLYPLSYTTRILLLSNG